MAKLTFTVGGDLYEVEGASLDDLKSEIASIKDKELADLLVETKQFLVANSVFTGAAQKESKAAAAAASADTPPWQAASDVPTCDHGPMTDLRGSRNKQGEPYKHAFYCNAPKGVAWKDKCAPRD